MGSSNWVAQHPLRLLNEENQLPKSEVSLLLARSGDGKSAALINFALYELMKGEAVWHFSSDSHQEKVHEYYQEIYHDLIRSRWDAEPDNWDCLAVNLTVICYQDFAQMIQAIESEVGTLGEGTKKAPSLMLMEGLDEGDHAEAALETFARVAREKEIRVLASMRVHRSESGHVNLAGAKAICAKYARSIFFLDSAAEQSLLYAVSASGEDPLPFFLCPHELIFKERN